QPYYLDVTHPKANKGEVVKIMSDLLKIAPDEIATIGDQPNDVLMFVKSGVSIAMGQASEEVQKSATYVTTSSEDEGFANAMQNFIIQRHAAHSEALRAKSPIAARNSDASKMLCGRSTAAPQTPRRKHKGSSSSEANRQVTF